MRNKGLDEIVGIYRGINKNYTHPKSKYRMNLPVYPAYSTYEDALASNENGFVYAVRVSKPYMEIADLTFPVLYVNIPSKDPSIARKSYNIAIQNHYNPLRWVLRRREHMDYLVHVTCKLI